MEPYDWINEFYSFYMADLVGIINMRDLTITVRYTNQPNKSKLALYKPWIHSYSNFKIAVHK